MAAGSEALILKVSADTSDVQSGLAPMTSALDKIAKEAADAEQELRALSDVGIDTSGIVRMEHQLDSLEDEIDATRDAMRDLDATEVKLDVKDEAIRNARERIDDLREQLAKEVTLGVSTKDTERQLSNLQSAVKKLTDTPAVVDVDVDISDEELAGVESLREGALGMGEALGNAGTSMQSFSDIGREAVPLLADLNTTMLALRMEAAAAGTAMGRFGSGVSKVTTFMAGPWGLAIAAGVGLLAAFASQSDDAADAANDLTDAINLQKGVFDQNNRQLAANKLEQLGALEMAEQLGMSTEDLVTALLQQKDILEFMPPLTLANMREWNKLAGAYNEASEAAGLSSDKNVRLAQAIGDVGEASAVAGPLLSSTLDTVAYRADVWQDFADQVDDARSALDKIVSSIDILNGRFATTREATAKYAEAVETANKAIEENHEAVTKGGAAFDTNAKKGRDNEKALLDMAKAAEDLTRARLADADASGESTDDILADYRKQRASLLETADRMGLNETAAKKYVDSLLQTPDEIATEVELTGYGKAQSQMKALTKDQEATVHVRLQMEKWDTLPKRIQDAISGNGSVNLSAASAAPAPGLTLLQPRLYLDSVPIRAAMRTDVASTVAAQLAATRTRGRL